jgi:hypothetical protein
VKLSLRLLLPDAIAWIPYLPFGLRLCEIISVLALVGNESASTAGLLGRSI